MKFRPNVGTLAAAALTATVLTCGPAAAQTAQPERQMPLEKGNRTVNYDPHNSYYHGGGYYDRGFVGHPWAAGAAGLAAGAALGVGAATSEGFLKPYGFGNLYPYTPCRGTPPYPPCN